MITPEDREAGLSSALIALQSLGGALSRSRSSDKKSLTAQVVRLGWKILPIPEFYAAKQIWHDPRSGGGNPGCIDFWHPSEWLIVPPDGSSLRARKVSGGKIRAIRAAYRPAHHEAQATGTVWRAEADRAGGRLTDPARVRFVA